MRIHSFCVSFAGLAACGGSSTVFTDAAVDARVVDGRASDASADAAPDAASFVYSCGAFTQDPGWVLRAGFHAVVIADATSGTLSQPVAAVVAGGEFGGAVYVVNQGDNTLRAVDPQTGAATAVVAMGQWATTPRLLTTIAWDHAGVFDGALYVGDQGGDGDSDSTIYRVGPDRTSQAFATAPGPGLDDIYGLAFSPGGEYGAGLLVTGDTDGSGVDWGRIDASGASTAFSELAGVQGLAFDIASIYGGGLFASRPATGGFAGDDAISQVNPDGTLGAAALSAKPGVHAVTFAPAGPFGGKMYAASWQSGELFSVEPGGGVTVLASNLQLTNYDGNILAFSSDGRVLYVADRLANRLVCIEPT